LGDGFGPILFFSNFFGESFLSEIFVNWPFKNKQTQVQSQLNVI
jgi:hypothetical protein